MRERQRQARFAALSGRRSTGRRSTLSDKETQRVVSIGFTWGTPRQKVPKKTPKRIPGRAPTSPLPAAI